VRRTLDLDDRVRHREPPARELLLKLRLVVDVGRERVLDPVSERGEDRRPDALEAVLQVDRPERGLDQRREDVPIRREPLELVGGDVVAAVLDELPSEVEVAPDRRAALTRDDVRSDLRQAAFGVVGKALVELARDREPEDGVAEELEALVRCRAALRP
jgi:hypothetical protein